jgi:hypothetical protein
MQNLRILICAVALSLFAAGAATAEKKDEAAKPQLTYYYFDG